MIALVAKNMATRARNTEGRDWTPSAENPLVVVIADEYMDLHRDDPEGSKSPLAKYVRKGRAVGYVAWLGTQSGAEVADGRYPRLHPAADRDGGAEP
jgi:DNA segregation ATPase FtsK/SpoIIIE-like protein